MVYAIALGIFQICFSSLGKLTPWLSTDPQIYDRADPVVMVWLVSLKTFNGSGSFKADPVVLILVLSSARSLQIWGSGLTGLEALGVMLTRLTMVYRAGGVYLTPWFVGLTSVRSRWGSWGRLAMV